jgi:hypothetical protein
VIASSVDGELDVEKGSNAGAVVVTVAVVSTLHHDRSRPVTMVTLCEASRMKAIPLPRQVKKRVIRLLVGGRYVLPQEGGYGGHMLEQGRRGG